MANTGNASRFIVDTFKSPVRKIIDGISSAIFGNLPSNAIGVSQSSAKALFDVGAAYDSISSITAAKTDSIVSGAADEFFVFAGKTVNRAAGVDIARLRTMQSENPQTYINDINPSTKLARMEENRADLFISVI
jgi:hypothetical protein